MGPDTPKYKLEIDGTDYINDLDGDVAFRPVIRRDIRFHSAIATFSAQEMTFGGAAYSYLKQQKETDHGAVASSTFVVKVLDWATETYQTLVSGTVDYRNTYDNDIVEGKITVSFIPDSANEKILNRADITTSLQKLEDFDGTAITGFTSNHGETYTLSLTKTELPNVTEVATSNCEIMLAWEVFLRLAQKILGKDDALRSDLFGRTDASVFTSAADGTLAFLGFTNGGLIRTGTTSNFPIKISLQEAFDAVYQIRPIGMSIEYIGGSPFLRVEDIDYFYDKDTTAVVTIASPESLRVRSNPGRIYGKVFSGYRIYDKSDDSGYIRSPHTERTWNTGLDTVSSVEYNTRTNVAASGYLMEVVRNDQIDANETSNEMDDQIFMIMTKRDGATDFEVDNDYVTSDLDDPTTQKNYLLMPGRCILNHQKIINAGLIREYKYKEANDSPFTGYSPIRFQSGQGNFTASTKIGSEASAIAENADLSAGTEPIFYEDDLIIQAPISEDDYLSLITGNNVNVRVPITYDGVTYLGFWDELEFIDLYTVRGILKQANPNYS